MRHSMTYARPTRKAYVVSASRAAAGATYHRVTVLPEKERRTRGHELHTV